MAERLTFFPVKEAVQMETFPPVEAYEAQDASARLLLTAPFLGFLANNESVDLLPKTAEATEGPAHDFTFETTVPLVPPYEFTAADAAQALAQQFEAPNL